MKKAVLLSAYLLSGFIFFGAGRCSNLVIDHAVSAADGNDYTIILQGYGHVGGKGYLFAQSREGAESSSLITLYFPKVECKRDSCIRYQFFRKDGSYGPGGALAKDSGSAFHSIGEIVGHATPLTRDDEGEYGIAAIIYYTGPDGIEYSAVAKGFVRLNILRNDYRPMTCDDPAKAWSAEITKDCQAQFTTGMRSVLCGKCE